MSSTARLVDQLAEAGITEIDPLYAPDELQTLAAAIDPLFAAQADRDRAYVRSDELCERGLLDLVFNDRMVTVLRSLLPDPQIYHCLIYEIAANQLQPHINGAMLNGWHRDADTVDGYGPGRPTHLSIFVYLTEVASGSGGFEIVPTPPGPRRDLNGAASIEVLGDPGTSFVWNRSFFHRASPNTGPVRRRVLKLSVQPVGVPNDLIDSDEFRSVRSALTEDSFLGQLFGLAHASTEEPVDPGGVSLRPLHANSIVSVSKRDVLAGWALDTGTAALARSMDALTR